MTATTVTIDMLRRTKVCLDEGPSFDAMILVGEFWNGAAIPYFDDDTVRAIAREMEGWCDEDRYLLQKVGDTWFGSWGTDGDEEWCGTYAHEPVMIDGVPHYDIGARYWTWQESECGEAEENRRDP
jgi:hypothetical protein